MVLFLECMIDPRAQGSDQFLPCYVQSDTDMTDVRLRAKAIQALVAAVMRYGSGNYRAVATNVADKFNAEDAGYWGCFAEHVSGARAAVRFVFCNGNKIHIRVGTVIVTLWRQHC